MFASTLRRLPLARAAAAAGAAAATVAAYSTTAEAKPKPVTRIIRFTASDGQTYMGEEPSPGATTAELITGDLYAPESLVRTGEKKHVTKLLSPIVPPAIFCIGLNYMKHYEESAKKRGVPLPDKPVIFMKQNYSLNHPGGEVWLPDIDKGEQLDWEVELTIVIGKPCRNVSKEQALDYVLGYTVGNDVSSRHWQKNAGGAQWVKGKSMDTHCPLGPVLVTAAEIPDPQKLQVITRVNGAVQQDENTKDMIFSCAECISWLSQSMTLEPGTVIMTGTPAGVAAGRSPPNWLVPGDVVECEIPGIGVLRNPIVMAPDAKK